jgi:hypothetical protein
MAVVVGSRTQCASVYFANSPGGEGVQDLVVQRKIFNILRKQDCQSIEKSNCLFVGKRAVNSVYVVVRCAWWVCINNKNSAFSAVFPLAMPRPPLSTANSRHLLRAAVLVAGPRDGAALRLTHPRS